MCMWIEYRCIDRDESWSKGAGIDIGDRCLSHDNTGPMGLAHDSRASVLRVLRSLDKDARSSGWVRTRDGWVCPYCASKRASRLRDTPKGGEP